MRIQGTSNVEKDIAIFEYKNDGTIELYSKNGSEFISHDEMKKIRARPITGKYLLVKVDRKTYETKDLSLQQQYEAFIKEAEKLKKLTNGKINLYKTGCVTKTSLQLFTDFLTITQPVRIEDYEIEIIEKCNNGALRYSRKYKGKAFKYDICSCYPFIMQNRYMNFPTGRGKLKTLTKIEFGEMKFFKYGIYHVQVDNIDYSLFSHNRDNWYTHFELNRAIELKYKLTLLEHENNVLIYDELTNGTKLFKEYIDYLFKFKRAKHNEIKKYMNRLWGALVKLNSLNINSKKHKVKDNVQVLELMPMNGENEVIAKVATEKYYENSFARIKPFITARARCMISKLMEKNKDDIIYVHTDGFILTQPIDASVKLGNDLGDLEYEGICDNCEVKNSNCAIGEFEIKKKTSMKRA